MSEASLNKPPTLNDVARIAGVSKATAAQVWRGTGRISVATRAVVLEAAEQIGYNPNPHAQRLAIGRSSNLIGVYSLNLDIGLETYKIKSIQKRLTEQGFDVPIYSYGSYGGGEKVNEAALMRSLCAQRPAAVVCFTFGVQDDVIAELHTFEQQGGIVICYGNDREMPFDNVMYGLGDAIHDATRHLLELGHRKIGFGLHGAAPGGIENNIGSFKRALGEFGLVPNMDWVFHGSLYEEAGIRYAARFLSLADRPTALHLPNDVAASAFINEVQRAGVRVPQDLSVVGLNDSPAARCAAVPLTTVSQPTEEIVGHIIHLLEDRLQNPGEKNARCVQVSGQLVPRESSAPPGGLASNSPDSRFQPHPELSQL